MTILKTRFHKPTITSNIIPRKRIVDLLNQNSEKPLILVSAPAGYGKSTAVSQWLELQEKPYAWLSVDHIFNNFTVFLEYFALALSSFRSLDEQKVQDFVESSSVLSTHAIAEKVCNYLSENMGPGIMVLDDYHKIQNPDIHELINYLLNFCPVTKQLIVITRFDPPLKLNQHRLYGRLAEVRIADLIIDSQEFDNLIKNNESELSENSSLVLEKSEGWILGISMLLQINSTGKQNLDNILTANVLTDMDFLLGEYLPQLPESFTEPLLLASICERFNEEILEGLFHKYLTQTVNVQDFIAKLKEYNLFLIAEDNLNEWYRFHHLFSRVLRRQLKKLTTINNDNALLYISEWFASNGYIEEAIAYVLRKGDLETASALVTQHRREAFNRGQWWRVKAWLDQLPDNLIKSKPSILIAYVWVLENYWNLSETHQAIFLLEHVIKKGASDLETSEYYFHLSFHALFFHSSPDKALKYAEKSIGLYEDGEMLGARREMVMAFCMQMLGKSKEAIKMLEETEKAYDPGEVMHLRSYSSRLFVLLLSGKFVEAKNVSQRFNYIVRNTFRYMEAWSIYLAANIDFQNFDSPKVVDSLLKAHDYEGAVDWRAYMDCYAGLCLCYIISNDVDAAVEALKNMETKQKQIKGGLFSHMFKSAQMRVYWLMGEQQKALVWANEKLELDMNAVDPLMSIEVPPLTRIRILITYGNSEELQQGLNLLDSFETLVHSVYNSYNDIDILLLKALAWKRLKDENQVSIFLKKAFDVYDIQRITRPFREFMIVAPNLFEGLDDVPLNLQHIISAKPKKLTKLQVFSKNRGNGHEELTRREQEIVKLICSGLRNKEIADQLHISTTTVKSHLTNIYGKLNVRNRTSMIRMVQNTD
ncbi:LuxR C-terminal-related transcriptional regulator [Prolixibacteraceae bacterium Z1-6]|uniref:LuxR C-terminal-related transcriptional regulator n=1 Tax=Draconibacterium aestuarii TaxID=2998507 RepID=A0A9X3F3L4_9BACT|nr:LuxR C-terminal-related transcriptional regulator [Prolixibacteraceae bacterium Z1-6]